MSFRVQVYIFPTRHAAALFLNGNPHVNIEHVYFNTDPNPTIAFPLERDSFVDRGEVLRALNPVGRAEQYERPWEGVSEAVLHAAFTGGPGRGPRAPLALQGPGLGPAPAALRLRPDSKEARKLSNVDKRELVEVRSMVRAVKANHARYINQGWVYNTDTNVWSIPAFKYASFVELETIVNAGEVEFPEGHRITDSDRALLAEIVKDIDRSSTIRGQVSIMTEEATQHILKKIAIQIQLNGTAKWGHTCISSLGTEENRNLLLQIARLKLEIGRDEALLARGMDPISIIPVHARITNLKSALALIQQQFSISTAQRAHNSTIEEIDAKIKELAEKILMAETRISAREAEFQELNHAERVQECADALRFDIREFRLDIEDLEVMIASFNCVAANQEIGAILAQNVATLQLLSLSILEPEVQALKRIPKTRIPKTKLMEDLTALATSNYRRELYNTTGGVMGAVGRVGRGTRKVIGSVLETASQAQPGNFLGIKHLATSGTRRVGKAISGALSSVRNSLSGYFQPPVAPLHRFSQQSATSAALNRAMRAPAPLHEGIDLSLLGRPQHRPVLLRGPGLEDLEALARGSGDMRWQHGVMPPGMRRDGMWVEGMPSSPSKLPTWPEAAAGLAQPRFGPLASAAAEEFVSAGLAQPRFGPLASAAAAQAYAMPGGLASHDSGEGDFPLQAARNPLRHFSMSNSRHGTARNVSSRPGNNLSQRLNAALKHPRKRSNGISTHATGLGAALGAARQKTTKRSNVSGKNKPRSP